MAHRPTFSGRARIKGSSPCQRMVLLTFSLIGLQFTWGVEMTYFTPYLLKLGLAKSQTALVWIAPPLSGLVVQPIIGTISDSSSMKWGRRRPFMLVSSILVAICLLTLAWATEVVTTLVGTQNEGSVKSGTLALAVFCIYAVDFAINAVQATSRSLIVDTLPVSQQQSGSAWAGRMLGLGHVLGYLAGSLDLTKLFGNALGTSQFKQICVIASVNMVFCVGVTCYCVEERVLLSGGTSNVKSGIFQILATIVKTAWRLPRKMHAVCWITFWSWIGWSPFHVYGSTWVGETYYHQDATSLAELKASSDAVGDIARKGSLALVLFSIISLAGSVFLPLIVSSSVDDRQASLLKPSSTTTGRLQRFQPNLTTAWAVSQLAFAASMILAPFSHSFRFATTLIALCGLPWAMYGWAPLALMAEEINKLETPTSNREMYSRLGQQDEPLELERLSAEPNPSPVAADLTRGPALEEISSSEVGHVAGVYLGIWNIYATIPQFLVTFISMVVFSIFEPGVSPDFVQSDVEKGRGGNIPEETTNAISGTAICLAIGAVCSFVAAVQTFRLRRL